MSSRAVHVYQWHRRPMISPDGARLTRISEVERNGGGIQLFRGTTNADSGSRFTNPCEPPNHQFAIHHEIKILSSSRPDAARLRRRRFGHFVLPYSAWRGS